MKNKKLIFGFVFILVIAISGFWLWQSQAQAASEKETLDATGVIEARQVILAPEVSGLVVEVLVEEGQRVNVGQPLIKLDVSMLTAQRNQAQAALQAAQAHLALLEAGATEEQIKTAQAQLAQAEANLWMAQANLYALTAGTRPEAVTALQASLGRARAQYYDLEVVITTEQIEAVRETLTTAESNLSAAKARYADLIDDSRNPAYILAAAKATVADAQAAVGITQQLYDMLTDETQPYYRQIELARQSWELAQVNLAQIQARHDGLSNDDDATPDALDAFETTLDDAQELETVSKTAYEALSSGMAALQLEAAWDEIQRLQTQLAASATGRGAGALPVVETALAQVDIASAQRDVAAANLAASQRGARDEEIEAAEAQVDAAQAQLDTLDVQLKKFVITAPWNGIVLARSVEPGEAVLPGATLLEIGRLDLLELTVYLPEDRFGLVGPGQAANVRVDAYPDQVFSGTVLRVADESEFTPTNIQTKDDRVRLVYAVVISLENTDLELKPGMIADASFGQ